MHENTSVFERDRNDIRNSLFIGDAQVVKAAAFATGCLIGYLTFFVMALKGTKFKDNNG